MTTLHRALSGVLACAAMLAPWVARADVRDECASASESAQRLRAEGKLVAARGRLLECVRPACPAVVKGDCEHQLSEVDAAMPSLVVSAKGPSGSDAVAVRVFVDGAAVRERLDGMSFPIDPGEHVLRFEMAGAKPAVLNVLVAEAQRNRPIAVAFEPLAPPPRTVVEPPPPPPLLQKRASPLAYVFTTLGGAGLAAFAFFQTRAIVRSHDLHASCAPRCPQSDVNDVSSDVVAAHVTLVGALVAGAAATALFVVAPWPSSRTVAFASPTGLGLKTEF